jgi:hypothetical protein
VERVKVIGKRGKLKIHGNRKENILAPLKMMCFPSVAIFLITIFS